MTMKYPKTATPIAALVLAALIAGGCGGSPHETSTAPKTAKIKNVDTPNFEVVVFMMAKCPHCASMLKVLLPLKKDFGDDLALSFGYVGRVDEQGKATASKDDPEVAAAEVQLCAGMTAPNDLWIDFMTCTYEGEIWRTFPKDWTRCAEKAKIDVAAVKTCINKGYGLEELKKSIEIAATEGIIGAPTMFINGRRFMGERSRDQLLQNICYTSSAKDIERPKVCNSVEPLPKVIATLLVDARCNDPQQCDVDREVDFIQALLPTMELSRLDYSTSKGKALYKRIVEGEGPATLPVLVLDEKFNEFKDIKGHMEEHLMLLGNDFIIPLGIGWDPTREICDNKKDDNDNGLVDCDDQGCAKTLLCREEQKGKLDLFIMSQCPFGVGMLPSVDIFLDHLGRNSQKVDFKLHFIGQEVDGVLDSMHGDSEIEEDLRMVCAQELYPEKYRFMEYLKCRAKRYHSSEWEECVPKWMNKAKLKKCAEGERGHKLLLKSFELAGDVLFTGSPSWMLNNHMEIEGRSAVAILAAFCSQNHIDECKISIKNPDPASEDSTADRCE